MSSYLFKLTAGKEFKDDKDFYFQGRVVNCRILKSRSGYNAVTLPLVYHSKKGFDDVFTSFYFLKENDILKGGGRSGFFLPNCEAVKFTQKDFYKTYRDNETFRERFDELISERFSNIIDAKTAEGAESSGGDSGDMDEEFED